MCAGWGRVHVTQKACLAWLPSLKLDKQGGASLRPPENRGAEGRGGRETPIILKMDMAVLLKVILKQTFLSQAFQPRA